MKLDREHFPQVAGLITWAVVFAVIIAGYGASASPLALLLVIGLFLVYLVCFIVLTWPSAPRAQPGIVPGTLFAIQVLSAFALVYLIPEFELAILTIIWVAVLPTYYSFRTSLILLVVVVTAWFTAYSVRWDTGGLLPSALLFGAFHVFAILMTEATKSAQLASMEATRLNAELRTAQGLLEQATRQNERTRIARDLHDLLGHHLTALIINLQVAGHLDQDEARQKIEQCHSIAKLLLSDVREAVSTLRENESLDFVAMVDLMTENIPGLMVHRQFDVDLDLEDLLIAKNLLSCIQEAITNTLRHSGADAFSIHLSQKDDELLLECFDNGEITAGYVKGNGLKGFEERIMEMSGSVHFDRVDGALHIAATIPLARTMAET